MAKVEILATGNDRIRLHFRLSAQNVLLDGGQVYHFEVKDHESVLVTDASEKTHARKIHEMPSNARKESENKEVTG